MSFRSRIVKGFFFCFFLVLDVATNLSFHIITTVSTRIVTVIIGLPDLAIILLVGLQGGKERVC